MVPAPFSMPASLLMSEPTMVPAPAEPEQMFHCRYLEESQKYGTDTEPLLVSPHPYSRLGAHLTYEF